MDRILAALACTAALAASGAEPVEVTITPLEQTITVGQQPIFHAVVRALEPTRVLDIARRDDLRDKVLRPRLFTEDRSFSQDDVPVDLKTMGKIEDGDYIEIKPGQAYVFDTKGEPLVLQTLPPGDYEVIIRYRRDLSAPQINSNRVKLHVSR